MARSIYLEGLAHGTNPIPAGAVVNGLLVSGAIFGMDPSTGRLAGTPEQQCSHLFAHVRSLVEAAGGTTKDIVKMTFYLQPDIDRAVINDEWVREFPDPAQRPARHTQVTRHLPSAMFLQADLMAHLRDTRHH